MVVFLLGRNKAEVPFGLSDKEIWDSLPLGDTWDDADLCTCFFYLWDRRGYIPATWETSMAEFAEELRRTVGADPDLVSQYNKAREGKL